MIYKIYQEQNTKFYIYILFVVSLFISSIFGENSSGGSKLDSEITRQFIDAFSKNFDNGINHFIKTGQIQSPFFYFIISISEKYLGKPFLNIIYIILSSCIPIIFYISLKKKFRNIDKNILFFISLIIFLSPYMRSSAVWITNDNLAILFFLLSISKYLSLKKNDNIKTYLLCFFYLTLATYIRQYYAIFFLIYFLKLFKNFQFRKIIIVNFVLILTMVPQLIFYYFFYKENLSRITSPNISEFPLKLDLAKNLLVFLSLYFFYLVPFCFDNFSKIKKYFSDNFKLNISLISLLFIYVFFNPFFLDEFGGGAFYKIAKMYNFKYFFYLTSLLGLILLSLNLNKHNFIVYFCLIFAFPFPVIYQKYFDPLLLITVMTLTQKGYLNEIINNYKINFKLIFLYFSLFLISSNFYYSFKL